MLDPAATQTGVGVAQRKDGAEKIDYRAGERRFSLPARAVRTHTVCRPPQLIIDVQPKPITARPRDGESYVVR